MSVIKERMRVVSAETLLAAMPATTTALFALILRWEYLLFLAVKENGDVVPCLNYTRGLAVWSDVSLVRPQPMHLTSKSFYADSDAEAIESYWRIAMLMRRELWIAPINADAVDRIQQLDRIGNALASYIPQNKGFMRALVAYRLVLPSLLAAAKLLLLPAAE